METCSAKLQTQKTSLLPTTSQNEGSLDMLKCRWSTKILKSIFKISKNRLVNYHALKGVASCFMDSTCIT